MMSFASFLNSDGYSRMIEKITTVINFCTNDIRFLKKCVQEASLFSHEVIVVTSDHFFDGTKENRQLLNQIYSSSLPCRFIEYAYLKNNLYSRFITSDSQDQMWQMYWYGTSRFIGYLYANQPDYFLFLDADEIVDGQRFLNWLAQKKHIEFDAQRLLSYFYFRKPSLQALFWPPNAFFMKKGALPSHFLINDWDRKGAYSRIKGVKNDKGLGIDHLPLIHHYSWVRTLQECHKKAETSGHWWEADWHALIQKEFAHEFEGTDFIFQYDYEKVEPYFDPFSSESSFAFHKKPDVLKVNLEDVLKKELQVEFFSERN